MIYDSLILYALGSLLFALGWHDQPAHPDEIEAGTEGSRSLHPEAQPILRVQQNPLLREPTVMPVR